jgi:hypothetical protein
VVIYCVCTLNMPFAFLFYRFLDIRKDGQWLVMVSESDNSDHIFLLN